MAHPYFDQFPKHLYADGPQTDATGKVYPSAVHAYNLAEEAVYRAMGYIDTYITQEYPKALYRTVKGKNPLTRAIEDQVEMKTAANGEQVKAYQRKGWKTQKEF